MKSAAVSTSALLRCCRSPYPAGRRRRCRRSTNVEFRYHLKNDRNTDKDVRAFVRAGAWSSELFWLQALPHPLFLLEQLYKYMLTNQQHAVWLRTAAEAGAAFVELYRTRLWVGGVRWGELLLLSFQRQERQNRRQKLRNKRKKKVNSSSRQIRYFFLPTILREVKYVVFGFVLWMDGRLKGWLYHAPHYSSSIQYSSRLDLLYLLTFRSHN